MSAFARRSALKPRTRRTGPMSRPYQPDNLARWRWQGPAFASPLLAPGDPFHDETRFISRRTPMGLKEIELLTSFNYLDKEALLAFEGIGPTLAANILAHRASAQYFASLDELSLVPLIGAKRFAKLVGRPPETTRFLLHDLMRRPRRQDIHFADLRPWTRPAPGLAYIRLQVAGEAPPVVSLGQSLLTVRVRGYDLHFVCTEPPHGGRAGFVHHNLPRALRAILP